MKLIRCTLSTALLLVFAIGCSGNQIPSEAGKRHLNDGSHLIKTDDSVKKDEPTTKKCSLYEVPSVNGSDGTAPRLHQAEVAGPVLAGESGKLTLDVTDDVSGLSPWTGYCHEIARVDDVYGATIGVCGTYRAVGGSSYELDFEVNRRQRPGEYFVKTIILKDNAGNSIQYNATYRGNGDYDLLPTYFVNQPEPQDCQQVITEIPVARFEIRQR